MIARISRPLAAVALACSAPLAAQDIAVRAERVHTMAGPPIQDGVVLVRGGKIVAVGPAATVRIPEGVETLTAKVATPGLVDAHSVVGLSGYMNQPHDQDQLDRGAPVQPHLRAVDGYNPDEELVGWLRSLGVTTVHTGHGPGALVSGQTMVAKTWGRTADAAAIVPRAMIASNLGPGALNAEKGPGTRPRQMALFRAALLAARTAKPEKPRERRAGGEGESRSERENEENPAETAKPDGFPADPDTNTRRGEGRAGSKAERENEEKAEKLEAQVWRAVLARQVPLLVTANRAQDIMSALRLKREFGIDLVIDGGAESYLLLDELRAAKVTVILHPTMQRHYGDLENASFTTAARLRAAGIPFALQSGFEEYVPKTRVVLWEAGFAAAHGLAPEDALRAVTIDAARAIGVADRLGSLEPGKDGDLALFDGDPLEYTSHVTAVVIDGRIASRVAR
jgi:imidazolonepropionase-like amidohydrolase